MTGTSFLKKQYDNTARDGDYGKYQILPFIIQAKPLSFHFTLYKEFKIDAHKESFVKMISHKMASNGEDFCIKGFSKFCLGTAKVFIFLITTIS